MGVVVGLMAGISVGVVAGGLLGPLTGLALPRREEEPAMELGVVGRDERHSVPGAHDNDREPNVPGARPTEGPPE